MLIALYLQHSSVEIYNIIQNAAEESGPDHTTFRLSLRPL